MTMTSDKSGQSGQPATISRAILSVSDKRGLVELARGLAQLGVAMISTGGTARALRQAGLEVRSVSEHTGHPELLGGRVKTLHPRVHAGILCRGTEDERRELAEAGHCPDLPELIDLVVVNLYPFAATVADPGVAHDDAVERIDIGGPTMIRAAAKNHQRVAVIVDPDDYPAILEELRDAARTSASAARGDGIPALSAATRFALARKAFAHTAAYDAAIASYMNALDEPGSSTRRRFPEVLTAQWQRVADLRYGENPHQHAAFYADAHVLGSDPGRAAGPSVAASEILQGKALSYNNILDLDAALACVLDLDGPAAVVVKHTNPCGAAVDAAGVAAAYRRARATDPKSSFGGIVAVNRPVDEELAALLGETFLECVIAPDFTDQARARLSRKKKLRLLRTGQTREATDTGQRYALRSVAGGLLVQSADRFAPGQADPAHAGRVVSQRPPTDEELATLSFAWRVVKHVKSNAIVYCRGTETVGVGAGQMSRVDAAHIARDKAEKPLHGTCVASDAFFPFRDGIDELARAGATAVIQPGGSVRDQEVIDAADEHGMAMVFTGARHFRH